MKKYYFTFDAETMGLWGEAFCIAGAILDDEGKVLDQFVGRCSIKGEIDSWVKENVIPQLTEIPVEYKDYKDLLKAFSTFWLKWKDKVSTTITHMGMIVESKILRDMHEAGYIGDWEAPYITADCASFTQVGDSVDTYAKTHGIKVNPSEFSGGAHNPLYDALVAGLVYLDVIKK